ncbi:hypothetical protein Rhal01_00952 [Rubritalea halochordaticola]|uniref:L,D-TPase catalytic domain-containing protein n=1 Tax=Rubritalea halochordaticola TaxID=714537 RepID=A0ABP9UX37_9BACT
MLNFLHFITVFCTLALCTQAFAQSGSEGIPEERQEVVRLQIFLDQNHFGPGVIDGKMGTYTKMAVEAYNKRNGLAEGDWDAVKKLAAQEVQEIYAVAIVPDLATKMVDSGFANNKNRSSQARRKSMPYRSIAEFMAERYHTTVDFLEIVNGKEKVKQATTRTPLIVPNVAPFRIELVADGRTHKKDPILSQRWAVIDTTKHQIRIYEPLEGAPPYEEQTSDALAENDELGSLDSSPPEQLESQPLVKTQVDGEALKSGAPPRALIIEEDSSAKPKLTPWDEHRALIVAAFPITPGQPQFIRRGQWKMMNAIEFPTWRYDASLLKTGQRSNSGLTIPSGPNNPVGVIWMGLSRRGIGIHGTDSPETIGRSRSAGCVRLTNWDAIELPNYIRPGATVFIK